MEALEASDVSAYPTCKICDRGTLTPRKIRRLSGPVVAIGYILLVPSILGMVACAPAQTLPNSSTTETAQPSPDNSAAEPAQSDTWQPFTSSAGHFSILFPAPPQQLKEPGSHVHGFSSSVDKGHTVYGVEYTDLRPGIGPEAVPQAILGAEEKIGIGKGLLVKDKIIDLHGVPGRAFEIVGSSGDTGLVREFFTWPYLYTVMVVARKGYTATHAARFFDSFRILDNPQAATAEGQAHPTVDDSTGDAAQPSGTLVRVFPTCQFGAIYGELCKPVWKRIEADNGEVTWIDMDLIRDIPPLHYVWVYTSVPNTAQNPNDMKMLMFDCQGHFQSTGGPVMDAPPRSVAGEIAATICAK
jgi:hypothetical protein